MTTITWMFIVGLGVISAVCLLKRSSQIDGYGDRSDRTWMIGLLALAMMLFCIVAQVIDYPLWARAGFWLFWFAFLLLTAWQWNRYNTSTQKVAVVAPPFAVAIAAIVIGYATLGPVLGLPLPGGGIKNVAVVGSLETQNTTKAESEALFEAIKAKECPTGVKYFAYEAQAGTNNMGPVIHLDTIEAGLYRFWTKAVCDPLWLAHAVHFIRYNVELDPAQAEADAKTYLSDPAKRAAERQFVHSKIVKVTLVDAGDVSYDSLGMIPGSNPEEMPKLTKFSLQHALGRTLVTELDDGSVRDFRGPCDIQASAPRKFVKVAPPATPEKPPSTKIPPKTITTPPSTSTTTTTVTTTTTPGTETTKTTPSTSTSTTTSTTGSSTTTTPPSSTTTTTNSTTSSTTSTTTTTTSPPSSTTTTSPKGDVPYPTDKPTVGPPPGDPETTPPVETEPADPATTPGQADPGQTAPGATQEPTQEPVPTVEPTGGADPTDPHEGDVDPDATTQTQQMGFSGLSVVAMLGLIWWTKRCERRNRRSLR